jgi:hypothetical protein
MTFTSQASHTPRATFTSLTKLVNILYDYVYANHKHKYNRKSTTLSHLVDPDNYRIPYHDPRIKPYMKEALEGAVYRGVMNGYEVYDGKRIRIFIAPLNESSDNNSKYSYLLSDLVIFGKTNNILLPICNMDVKHKDIKTYLRVLKPVDMYRVSITERFHDLKQVKGMDVTNKIKETIDVIRKSYPEFEHGNLTGETVYYDGKNIKLYHFEKSSLADKKNILNNNIMVYSSDSFELDSVTDSASQMSIHKSSNVITGTRRMPNKSTFKAKREKVEESEMDPQDDSSSSSEDKPKKQPSGMETPDTLSDVSSDDEAEMDTPENLDDIPTDSEMPVAKKQYTKSKNDFEDSDKMEMTESKPKGKQLSINKIGSALGIDKDYLSKMSTNAKHGPPTYEGLDGGRNAMMPSSSGMPTYMPRELGSPMNGMSFNSMNMPMMPQGMPMGMDGMSGMGMMPPGMPMGMDGMSGMMPQGMPGMGMDGMSGMGMMPQGMPMGMDGMSGMGMMPQGMPGMMPQGMPGMMPQMMGGGAGYQPNKSFFFNQ